MAGIVEVVIPVEAEAAAALTDSRKREAVGRIVSRIFRPQPDHDLLLDAMERLSADAKAKGLTPKTLKAELGAHKARADPLIVFDWHCHVNLASAALSALAPVRKFSEKR